MGLVFEGVKTKPFCLYRKCSSFFQIKMQVVRIIPFFKTYVGGRQCQKSLRLLLLIQLAVVFFELLVGFFLEFFHFFVVGGDHV